MNQANLRGFESDLAHHEADCRLGGAGNAYKSHFFPDTVNNRPFDLYLGEEKESPANQLGSYGSLIIDILSGLHPVS